MPDGGDQIALFEEVLPPAKAEEEFLAQAEGQIRGYGKLVISGIVEIGRKLIEVKDARWFQPFGRFAAAAAVGLLGVTLLALARPVVEFHPILLLGAAAACLSELCGVHPLILIAAATLIGAISSVIG
jgi:hypothetical protein